MMLYEPRASMDPGPTRGPRDGERGQTLVLFTLVIVLLMGLAAVVIDVGLLRTDGARLQNALDSGALAAGQSLPATSTNVAAISNTAVQFTRTNFSGVPTPTASFACLIGITAAGLPRVSDMPSTCNVSLPASSPSWVCTGTVCWAPCDPVARPTDVCNTIILADAVVRPFGFGAAIGVDSGNTGIRTAAACTGACGGQPQGPVDAVVILDRTGSMDQSRSVPSLRAGARAVLQAFDPSLQRVALGFTGPASLNRLTSDTSGQNASSQPSWSCANSPFDVHAIALDPGATVAGPLPTLVGNPSWAANASGGANTLAIPAPAGTQSGNFLLATVVVDGGTSRINNPLPNGWTQIRETDRGNDIGVATYRKFAGASDTGAGVTYTFRLSNNTRAVGGIVRYTGVNPSNPVSDDGGQASGGGGGNPVTAPSINPGDNSALVAVLGSDTGTTFGSWSAGMTEQLDQRNTSGSGPTIGIGTGSFASGSSTGTKTATTAASSRWAAQLIALQGVPGPADVYGTNVNAQADRDQWIPIGFSGTDTDSPPVTYREAYVDNAVPPNPIRNTHVVQAIGCFDVSGVGTNLARPLYMALKYLQLNGRPGAKWGVILETDGAPNNGGYGPSSDYTTAGVLAAATAVKTDPNKIELFTIGYGVDNSTITLLGSMATDRKNGDSCTPAENADGDHFFCAPTGGDLTGVLHAAAVSLSGGTKLIQLYPTPIVTSVAGSGGSSGGGQTITINGKYFTEAYSVTFSGTAARSFTVLSDTQIRAVTPAGTPLSTVDVQVSTPGGSSKIVGGDRYTYGP